MQARSGSDALAQQFARMTLAGLPRGGGDGDAIRHGILNIMRENGIREGHRPVSLTAPAPLPGTFSSAFPAAMRPPPSMQACFRQRLRHRVRRL